MDPRPGCLPLLLVLILAIGGLFVAVSSSSTVEMSSPAPVEALASPPTGD